MHINQFTLLLAFLTALLGLSTCNDDSQQAEHHIGHHVEPQTETQLDHHQGEAHSTNQDTKGMPPGTHIGVEGPAPTPPEILTYEKSIEPQSQQEPVMIELTPQPDPASVESRPCEGSRRHRHCIRSEEEMLTIGEVSELVVRGLSKLGEKVDKTGASEWVEYGVRLGELGKNKSRVGVERVLGLMGWRGRDEL